MLCLRQAKQVAGESAAAEARAAGAALRAVEAGIALYAEKRDYLKLKDIAEASDVAGKVWVLSFPRYNFRTVRVVKGQGTATIATRSRQNWVHPKSTAASSVPVSRESSRVRQLGPQHAWK